MSVDAVVLLDPPAAAVLELLRATDTVAGVVLHRLRSEVDVRITLGSETHVRVELLCPASGPPTECWHAVRIEADVREVWRGPVIGCCPTQVRDFLDDLLHSPAAVLAHRYRLLG